MILPITVVWDFNPVFFSIGSLDVRYYGLMWALALLIGAWFTAIGIFASSMTGSQIISGIITIGLLVLIFFMGLIPVVWGEFPAAGIFHYMSCSEHLDRFSAGLVDTRPVIFYLTMTVLTLAVTIRIIDHRRWKH